MDELMGDLAVSWADTLNPFNWFKEGQARDEARTIRLQDREQAERFHADQMGIAERNKQPPASSPHSGISLDLASNSVRGGGQNIMTASQRAESRLQQQLLQEQVRGVQLDNLKKEQLLNPPKTGSPEAGSNFMPDGSQVVRGGVVTKPLERTASFAGKPHMESGAINSVGFAVTPTGLSPIPSGDVKNRIEDSPYELTNFYRYGILPNFGVRDAAPPRTTEMIKAGLVWQWSRGAQEWRAIPMEDYDTDTWTDRTFKKIMKKVFNKDWRGE